MAINSILIVEDDLTFSKMLRTWLEKKGFQVETASSVTTAKKHLSQKAFDIVLSDLRLPDEDGLGLLSWLTKENHNSPVIIMTSYAEVQNAVKAMKQGAADYIAKPVQPDLLLEKINEAITKNRQTPQQQQTKKILHEAPLLIDGKSKAAKELYNYVGLVAPTQMSVLIQGASGTGKEHIAHRIHQLSKRADKPFVAIDCGALLKELSASEFFGHIKGSFTGALTDKTGAFVEANGGTLFLDEVGNLSYDVQVQLLRAIQEKRIRPVGSTREIAVDIRLICATNENLPQAIANGLFREDLFHRINEFTLHLPLLKDREEDILVFARFFLEEANKELEKDVIGFTPDASHAMMNYSWPGNLRQMKNIIKRATLLAQDNYISAKTLNLPTTEEALLNAPASATNSLRLYNEDHEKEQIIQALQATQNNKSKAAALLGIDRKTLYNKLKLYKIPQ